MKSRKHAIILLITLMAAEIGLQQHVIAGVDMPADKNTPYSITIERVGFGRNDYLDTLDIILSTQGRSVGGVDLRIGIDSPALDILEVLPGAIPDSCKWKIFNSRASLDRNTEKSPRAVWHILTVAEFGPDSIRADCQGLDGPASIARLVVIIDTSRTFDTTDSLFEVLFYWEDCSDNVITNARGDTLFIASSLNRFPVNELAGYSGTEPIQYAPPDSCVSPRAQSKPVKGIAFVNGGIIIKRPAGPDSDSE